MGDIVDYIPQSGAKDLASGLNKERRNHLLGAEPWPLPSMASRLIGCSTVQVGALSCWSGCSTAWRGCSNAQPAVASIATSQSWPGLEQGEGSSCSNNHHIKAGLRSLLLQQSSHQSRVAEPDGIIFGSWIRIRVRVKSWILILFKSFRGSK